MKYYVDYEDKHGDLSHVWVDADSSCEAESEVRREYWDCERIVSVHL